MLKKLLNEEHGCVGITLAGGLHAMNVVKMTPLVTGAVNLDTKEAGGKMLACGHWEINNTNGCKMPMM